MSNAKNYVWNATDYAKNSTNQLTWARELIPKLQLKDNEALLDIGCGDGKITAQLAKALPNGKVVGIDNSKEMIKLARTTFPSEEHPNLSFELVDAETIPYQGEFDVAFSNAALHWVLDQKAVLRGVYRSLKPRGRILFQMAGKGNAFAILGLFDTLRVMPQWKKYFDNFTFPYAFLDSTEYRALLEETGLKAVRVESFPRDMTFRDAEGLAGWIRTTWLPYTQRVPEQMRDGFVKEIVTRYLVDHPADNAGVIHLAMVRLEIEAIKP